jgi:hypothetical protein
MVAPRRRMFADEACSNWLQTPDESSVKARRARTSRGAERARKSRTRPSSKERFALEPGFAPPFAPATLSRL